VYLALGRDQEAKEHLQKARDLEVPTPVRGNLVALLNRVQ
jgi:hypothetical protein